jgi:SAM-dependent methyltransferase
MGCDTSGQQLAELARLTRGEVVGINVPEGFPSIEAVQNAGPRVKMFQMDGMNLTFPDKSFDLVISANVIEHVPDPAKFIHEAARVLKDDGVAYLETAPLWTSARGHHVMESMVAENCPEETQFRDDGSIIPEWSHLTLSRNEMEFTIGKKVLGPTRDYILRYLYDSRDLNKTPWREIAAACRTAFPHLQLMPRPLPGIDTRLIPTDGADDYSAYGFTAVGRKRPQGWISRRLNWRLRRIGL